MRIKRTWHVARGLLVGATAALGIFGQTDAEAAQPSGDASAQAPRAPINQALVSAAGSYIIHTGAECAATLRLNPTGELLLVQPDGVTAQGTWSVVGARGREGATFTFEVTVAHTNKEGKTVGKRRVHGKFTHDPDKRAIAGTATHEYQDGKGAVLKSQASRIEARRE